MKKKSLIICLVIFSCFLLSPVLVNATPATGGLGDITKQLEETGGQAFYGKAGTTPSAELPELIGKYINIFLGILGVLFVVLIVYGGYSWMTAYGNEQKLTKAKDTIINAVIGLIIIMAAYAISHFIIKGLIGATVT